MTPTTPLRDRELVKMLQDEPELLAIADALVATRDGLPASGGRPRLFAWIPGRPTSRAASLIAAAVVVGAAITLALVAPWNRSLSVTERALGAVGDQPVLHVVISQPADSAGPLVRAQDGQVIKRTQQTEIWFDHGRDLKKTVTTLDGAVLDETLESKQGGFSDGGPIYTCAWIASHPVEATRAGVSCNANGDNGTTPRSIPEQPPTIDEALSGFVDRYQSALASGAVREVGRGAIDHHEVIWLELSEPSSDNPATQQQGRERVAVDASTYKPLLVETAGGQTSFRVLTAETVGFSPSLFVKPELVTPTGGVGGTVSSSIEVQPQAARAALGGTAMWLGRTWRGFRLAQVRRDDLRIGFGPLSTSGPSAVTGVEFVYSRVGPDGSFDGQPSFTVSETTICTVMWGWTCTARDPSVTGTILLLGQRNLLREPGLYITIWNRGQPVTDALHVAQDLQRVAE